MLFTPGVLRELEGRSLGIWISRRIIELHGGRMTISALDGDIGNIIALELPVFFNDEPQNEATEPPSPPVFVSIFSATPRRTQSYRRRSPSPPSSRLLTAARPLNSVRVYSEHVSNVNEQYIGGRIGSVPENHVSATSSSNRGSGCRVLIVDDAMLNRKMLCRLIESYCGDIVTAKDGAEAMHEVETAIKDGNSFDLVMMDYQMPVIDGPSAARAMREMGHTGLIIGVTGNTLPTQIQTFIDSGANDVLAKPLSLEMLLQSLSDLGRDDILNSSSSHL
mmetsp:Transcript_10615/g.10692  ORF Transcript_10615/g.10692 Transcript_10615/m.10692 type:complete len:278 (+) Transcript_10615:44-877(+)